MAERVLVVDLLGGLGDLVMALPVVHALARRHPGAELRVLTHAPGDALLHHDPAVTAVVRAERGRERTAVVRELDAWRPDLVVTTTRYDGIADEIEARGQSCVTNLWRRPPADELVTGRYLRILAAEGVIDPADVDHPPRIHVTDGERSDGERLVTEDEPVVLVPSAGMAVKEWPNWRAFARALPRPPLVVGEQRVLDAWRGERARPLPPVDLRGLAALFAAVGRRRGVVVGPDTGPMRMAAAVGARTVGLFGATLASRYGLGHSDLQGLPHCPHRRPTSITEQVCWWTAHCPLSDAGPACMADIPVERVLAAVQPAASAVGQKYGSSGSTSGNLSR